MREIKFRVWDIENKRYIENTGNPYIFPFNGITAMKCAGSRCGSINGEKDYSEFYILEQWTGLLDKSGKEIYEGDMVRICNLECQLQIFEATGQVVERYAAWGVTNLKIIKFEKYSLKINPPNAIDIMYFLNILGCKHIEVIGNQFQSPKLLETKQ